MQTQSTYSDTLNIAVIGLLSALVFVGTFFFKIPTAFGYTHFGDCMILLTIFLFGTKRGILAGAVGAGLSDFFGGYIIWVLPTMSIKSLFALTVGSIMYHLIPNIKYSWLIGAIIGGILHTIGYVFINIIFYGVGAAAELLPNFIQSAIGIIIGSIAYLALAKIPSINELCEKLK